MREAAESRDNVEMAIGYGVKTAGIESCARHEEALARSRCRRNLSSNGTIRSLILADGLNGQSGIWRTAPLAALVAIAA